MCVGGEEAAEGEMLKGLESCEYFWCPALPPAPDFVIP